MQVHLFIYLIINLFMKQNKVKKVNTNRLCSGSIEREHKDYNSVAGGLICTLEN